MTLLRSVLYRVIMEICPDNHHPPGADCWSRWLNYGRDGGDSEFRTYIEAQTAAFAEKILSFVEHPPTTMLDIGSGHGLMVWAALSRWSQVRVVITDISKALLLQAQSEAIRRGFASRCNFMFANAETLEGAADNSQDLVTSRSALAYVADKPAAFRAALRVLKPGGIISIAEPLLREQALSATLLQQASVRAADSLLALLYRWKAAQFINHSGAGPADPLTSYTERDLLGFARQAGFCNLHLELHIDERSAPPREWSTFCAISPHPLAPSPAEILATRFSSVEREVLENALRPNIEKGGFRTTTHMIYLRARKPL